jgi:hypothetical protein
MRMSLPTKSAAIALVLAGMAALGFAESGGASPPGRWPAERAWQWHREKPWPVRCNFLPSTAVNDVEMWQRETFDPATIDRELGWARGLGFNSVRVFLNYVVWEADAEGLKQRMARFLQIADKHRISAMFILFDDCFKPEPSPWHHDIFRRDGKAYSEQEVGAIRAATGRSKNPEK